MTDYVPIIDGLQVFYISDGTRENTFDILGNFSLEAWPRAIQTMKDGGVWQDSPLADDRHLVDFRWSTVLEEFEINASAKDDDSLAAQIREMRRVLLRARSFWLAPSKIRPVFMARKKLGESVTRYALIHNFETPADGDTIKQDSPLGLVSEEYLVQIERSGWRKQPPGLDECLEFYHEAVDRDERRDALVFDQTDARAERAYHATLDKYEDQFAWDGWYKIDWATPAVGSVTAPICGMWDSGTVYEGWKYIIEEDSRGQILVSLWAYQDGPAIGNTGEKISFWELPSSIKGDWFHMALSTNSGWTACRLFVNGYLVPLYGYQNSGYTPVGSTANFVVGNYASYDETAGLKMGWQRLWQTNWFYSDPEPIDYEALCFTPDGPFAGAVVAAWQHEVGEGTNLTDLLVGWDLTMTNVEILAICNEAIGLPSDVRDCAAIALRNGNLPNLTHIFRYDASAAAFSTNQVENTGIDLFTFPSGAGDILYIGHTDVPIDVLLFNLATAAPPGWGMNYEAYTGAWTNIAPTMTDNTNGFTELGRNLFYLNQANTLTKTTINGVNAYWVRWTLTVAAMPSVPKMAIDHVQAQNKNWFLIDDLGGDIGVETQLRFESKYEKLTAYFSSKTYRMILGVKNIGEAPDFQATANFSDVFVGGADLSVGLLGGAFGADADAPTGRVVQKTMIATQQASLAAINISSSVASQYNGRFNVFVRVKTDVAAGGFDIYGSYASQNKVIGFDNILQSGTPYGVLTYNLGTMQLPVLDAGLLVGTEAQPPTWVTVSCTCNTPGTIKLVDIIFMPADEVYLDAYLTQRHKGTGADFTDTIEIGSVKTLTRNLLARIINNSDVVVEQMDYFCQRRFWLPATDRHMVTVLFIGNWPYMSTGASGEDFSDHRLLFETVMDGNELYLSSIPPGV